MRFTFTIVTAVLSLAACSHAWTQDPNNNGVWTANNNFYLIRGAWVHESCTYRNTETLHNDGEDCAFFIDGLGNQFRGHCSYQVPQQVLCL
ncbi:hypothetical protein B0J18DRAFT_488541 [Chaetomium sp. MPI-SDFR-AT-0129]|nr:hypothetical protein B0J18DRAFT_488541 [Chaetomium sp. MPI-SDFR-AT-0129]